jgi:hypothetical protein
MKDISFKLKSWWMSIWLPILYGSGLRKLWVKFCRWMYERNDGRIPVPKFQNYKQIWNYLRPTFKYREDPQHGMMDYASDPAKFHWRFLNSFLRDGDCDDAALFVATALLKVDNVDKDSIRIINIGYETGGHAVVFFETSNRNGHLFDWGFTELGTSGQYLVPTIIINRYTKPFAKKRAHYYSYETVDGKLICHGYLSTLIKRHN